MKSHEDNYDDNDCDDNFNDFDDDSDDFDDNSDDFDDNDDKKGDGWSFGLGRMTQPWLAGRQPSLSQSCKIHLQKIHFREIHFKKYIFTRYILRNTLSIFDTTLVGRLATKLH